MRSSHPQRLVVLTEVVMLLSKVVTTIHNGKIETLTRNVVSGQGDSGDTDIIYLTGVNQSHTGVEVEGKVAFFTRNG